MIDLKKLPASAKTVLLGLAGLAVAGGGWCIAQLGPEDGEGDAGPPGIEDAAPTPSDGGQLFDGGIGNVPPLPSTWDCSPGPGTDYQVGPGQSYSMDTVPWTILGPGDTVRVHWQAEPYRRRILISTKGAVNQPIKLCGMPGPDGQRPILDGEGSTPAALAGFRKPEHANLGMILLYASTAGDWDTRPAWVEIEGFEIRHAFSDYGNWSEGAAGVRINDGGDDVSVRANIIHDNSNGIFMSSTGPGNFLAERLLVEGNELYNNGGKASDSARSHQMYIQGVHTVVQANYIHDSRPGGNGTSIKDRSPGTIIRYNWISGGVISIDLVEPQEHYDAVKDMPDYDTAEVYGNIIITTGDVGRSIHFGQDVSDHARKGPLYLWNNTFHFQSSPTAWDVAMLDLDHPEGVAYANNNALWRDGGRADGPGITLIQDAGTLYLGTNAIGPKWVDKKNPAWPSSVVGTDQIISIAESGWAPGTYKPTVGSVLGNAAGPLDTHMFPPSLQYKMHADVEARMSATSLGALQ